MAATAISGPAFFRGAWIVPGHPDYEQARPVFNRRVDPRPVAVARCAGVADVVAALAWARERGLRVDVRSTGTNLGGLGQGGGVVIDLSLMRGVQILPERRVARIQGGVSGGDLQTEAGVHGLAGVTGGLSLTGVGLMLGGGIGHLASRAGYACDNILGVELVTADGRVVTASPEENPDLFWAVRGSTGNFGVVTSLEVRLHEVPPAVHAGAMSWELDNIDGPIRALREWDWASDNLNLLTEFSSTSFDGRGGLDMFVCHTGPTEQAQTEIERLRAFGVPDLESMDVAGYTEVTFMFDDAYSPTRTTINDQPVGALSDELVAALVDKIREPDHGGSRFIEILARRGALGRAPEFPSALREEAEDPTWMVVPGCWWDDPGADDAHDRWVSEVIDVTRRIGPVRSGHHPNTVGIGLDADGVRDMYEDRFDRLLKLKTEWDPDNVFAGNHNISTDH